MSNELVTVRFKLYDTVLTTRPPKPWDSYTGQLRLFAGYPVWWRPEGSPLGIPFDGDDLGGGITIRHYCEGHPVEKPRMVEMRLWRRRLPWERRCPYTIIEE